MMIHAGMPEADTRWRTRRFLFDFVVLYVLMHLAYFAIPDGVLSSILHEPGIATPVVWILQWTGLEAEVASTGGVLQSPQATVRIVRGCDGAGIAFLAMSAVCAFPARPAGRLLGVLVIGLFVYVINLLRIAGLFWIAAHRSEWFTLAHDFLGPVSLSAATALVFIWWVREPARPNHGQAV